MSKLDAITPEPCPFCGRPMLTQAAASVWWHKSMVDCIMSGKLIDKNFEAISAWNRRASPPSPAHVPEGTAEATGRGWRDLTCDDQFILASQIAANIGYVLAPEPSIQEAEDAAEDAESVEALALAESAWQELLDRDDRTSPADYPDMALISFDELVEFMARVTAAAQPKEPPHD